MDFDFTVPGIGGEPITVWDGNAVRSLPLVHLESFKTMLDVFGKRSAQAQGLGGPITDVYRLRSTDQRLYLYATRHAGNTLLLGGLKVGKKRLFVRMEDSSLREIEPTCVLDFYVHESCQRQGIGKELFEYFLAREGHSPAGVAYDRPSPKLLAFLHRHYGLIDHVPQNNNFVLFSAYWSVYPPPLNSSRRRPGHVMGGLAQPLGPAKTQPLPYDHQHPGSPGAVNLGVSLPGSSSVQGLAAAAHTQSPGFLEVQGLLPPPMSHAASHTWGSAVPVSVRNSMSLSSDDVRASRNFTSQHVPTLQLGTGQAAQETPTRLTPRGAAVGHHSHHPHKQGDSLDLFSMEASSQGPMYAPPNAPHSAGPPQASPPMVPGLRTTPQQGGGPQLQGMTYLRGHAPGASPVHVYSASAAPQATISGNMFSSGYPAAVPSGHTSPPAAAGVSPYSLATPWGTDAPQPGRQDRPGAPSHRGLPGAPPESSNTPVAGRRKGMTLSQQQQGVPYLESGPGSSSAHMTARAAALAARSGAGAASCFVW